MGRLFSVRHKEFSEHGGCPDAEWVPVAAQCHYEHWQDAHANLKNQSFAF